MFRTICGMVMMFVLTSGAAWADSLGIYTHRQPFLLEPILEAYTKKTGVTFQTVYAPKAGRPFAG